MCYSSCWTMHMLDCQLVHLTESACWPAGGNALYGTVPSSWASMAALQDLELDYNCGLCGSLPSFPMQVLAMSTVFIPCITTLRDSRCVGTCLAFSVVSTLSSNAESAVLHLWNCSVNFQALQTSLQQCQSLTKRPVI